MACMWEFFNSFILLHMNRRFTGMLLALLCPFMTAVGQPSAWWTSMPAGSLPEKILSARTAVIYMPYVAERELTTAHQWFMRTGIDAVTYAEADRVFASNEVTRAFAAYFAQREIANIIFLSRSNAQWQLTVAAFNNTPQLVATGQHRLAKPTPI